MKGQKPAIWIGSSKADLREFPADVRRTVRFAGAVYVLHSFQKKSKKGAETSKHDIDVVKIRLKAAEAHYRQNYEKGAKP